MPELALLVALFALALPVHAQSSNAAGASDSGVFQIMVGKTKVGTEKFQIKREANGWDVTGELQIESGGAKVSENCTLQLSADLRPATYQRTQKAPHAGKVDVRFGASETTLVASAEGGTGTEAGDPLEQIFYLPPNDLVVLDTNFFHHYALLLRLYDRAKGGAQPFNVFIPQEALPGTINLTYIGKEDGKTGKDLDHFEATTDQVQIEIWATPDGAIQRLSIPAGNLEVVRQ